MASLVSFTLINFSKIRKVSHPFPPPDMELDRFLAWSPLEWNYAVLDVFCWLGNKKRSDSPGDWRAGWVMKSGFSETSMANGILRKLHLMNAH